MGRKDQREVVMLRCGKTIVGGCHGDDRNITQFVNDTNANDKNENYSRLTN